MKKRSRTCLHTVNYGLRGLQLVSLCWMSSVWLLTTKMLHCLRNSLILTAWLKLKNQYGSSKAVMEKKWKKKKFESLKNYFTERRSDIKKKSRNLLIEDMSLAFTLHKNDNYSVNASAVYEMTPTNNGKRSLCIQKRVDRLKTMTRAVISFDQDLISAVNSKAVRQSILLSVKNSLKKKTSSNLLITSIQLKESLPLINDP